MTDTTANNLLVGLLLIVAPAMAAWVIRVERRLQAVRRLPADVGYLKRLTIRILMKVDPDAAQEELRERESV